MHSLVSRMLRDGWHVDAIDTARHVDYLNDAEKDVILATNALRSDPAKFARDYVGEIRERYDGQLLKCPNEIPIRTYEGTSAVDELYRLLHSLPSVGLLYPSRGLSRAAADHAYELSVTGRASHNGRDGSDPFSRMNRYGAWEGSAAENIAYGNGEGLRIVLQLAIDDGTVSRGHRTNLLSSDLRVSGVGINTHPEFGHVCTIDYAGGYIERM